MKLIPLYFIAALAACSTPTPVVTTQSATLSTASCPAWDDILTLAEAHGWNFAELPDEQRLTFIQTYDAEPPASHTMAEHVYIGRNPEDPDKRLVAFVHDGCVVGHGVMKPETIDRLVEGNPA